MAQVKGRVPFTDKDIVHLTKYLANYSENDSGRMGNRLYQDLVANAGGRWPWSQRHTWHSWRDHYKRNPDIYERRIRKYQRERAKLEDTSPAQPAGSKRKASGTADELHDAKRAKPAAGPLKPRTERSLFTDTEDEEEPATQEASQRRRVPEGESSQAVLRNGDEVAKTGVMKAGQALQRGKPPSTSQRQPQTNVKAAAVTAKPKPRLIPRKKIDDDPFLSSPAPTPPLSPPPPSSSRKQPPKYVEGPFRNTLSTATSSWPPTRRKSQTKPAPTANGSKLSTSPAYGKTAAQGQLVVGNATPSSSKNQLPPGKYKSIDEVIKAPAKGAPSSPSRRKAVKNHTPASAQSAHGSANKNLAPIKVSPTTKLTPVDKHARKDTVEPSKPLGVKNQSQPVPTSRSFPQSHDARPREASLHRRASEGDPGLHSDDAIEDVFMEKTVEPQPPKESRSRDLRKQMHAQRLADTPIDTPIPHIDLKDVSGSAASRRHSSISSASRTSSALAPSVSATRRDSLVSLASRRSSYNHAAAIRDVERFEKVGRQALLGELARRYGFDLAVAETAYERLRDLNKTDAFLKELSEEADSAGRALISKMLGEDDEEEKDDVGARVKKEEVTKRRVLGVEHESTPSISSTSQQLDRSQRRRSNGPRHSLTIRPIPAEELDRYALTVEAYSPPRRSRAGRYSRHSGAYKARVMPYSQTVWGSGDGDGAQGGESPPKVDLRYESSPVKRGREGGEGSLPPSSPPRGEGGEEGQDMDGEEDEEDEYEDLFGDAHRPTSPQEVEQELLSEQFEEDEDEGDDGDGDEDEDEDEDDAQNDDDDDDQDEDPDADIAVDMDEDDEDDQGRVHSPPAHTDDTRGTDTDTHPTDAYPEQYASPKQIFARLHPDEQQTQRLMARFANTTNRKNRHKMEEWEATLHPEKRKAHDLLLLQTVVERLRAGEGKPLRLDEYFDEALEEYSR